MSLSVRIDPAPEDEIIGVSEAAARDPNPSTMDLSVGGYCDDTGTVPLMGAVAEALDELAAGRGGRGYGPLLGRPAFHEAVLDLVLPNGSREQVVVAQAVGGTGALRLLLETWQRLHPKAPAWVTDPPYPNHPKVAAACHVGIGLFPHHPTDEGIDTAALAAAWSNMEPGDTVLLHGCCHNPTGRDPSPAQWAELAAIAGERDALAVIDLAYLGFAEGIHADLAAVRAFGDAGRPFAVCVSFSKNFLLGGERVGAVVVVAESARQAAALRTRLAAAARGLWSSPPRFGAELVTAVLTDSERRSRWEQELSAMAARIRRLRQQLRDSLAAGGAAVDLEGLVRQRGLFWWSGLTQAQMHRLRVEHSVYALDSGRMNLAAVPEDAVDHLAKAVVAVTTG
jgi:aromatic-amino-acid transaminase